MKDWCKRVTMPEPMSIHTHINRQTDIQTAVIDAAYKVTERYVCGIRSASHNTGIVEHKDGVVDIALSSDGAWRR